jgi:hypothetical protein
MALIKVLITNYLIESDFATFTAVSLQVNGSMSNRLAIRLEGIDPPALVAEIEQTIRDSFQEMALPGSWRVILRRSRVSGRWDFSVHGLDVRHTTSIAVPPNLLSSLISRRLGKSLRHWCSAGVEEGVRAPERTSMSVFRHPHLTRGVVKTAKGAFIISRGLVNMPDEIGESLGWRRVDSGDETPVDASRSPSPDSRVPEGHGQQQRG